jgi:hypothetical protein
MTVTAFERFRVRYEQGNRAAFWLLLALAVVVLAARHIAPLILVGRLDDRLLGGGDVLATMPVLLAAAAVVAVPGRRPIVVGTLMLAVAAVLLSARHLSPLLGGESAVLDWLTLAVAPSMVAGTLLIGYGLGGVHTRLGAVLVAGGLIVAVLAAVYAWNSAQPVLDSAASSGPALLVGSVLFQFTYLGWAYLLAAALERRATFIAIGVGLLVLADLSALALALLLRASTPGLVLPGAGTIFLLLSLAAWTALIVGVVREGDGGSAADKQQVSHG